jgi:hypothetical protein
MFALLSLRSTSLEEIAAEKGVSRLYDFRD